MQKVGWTGNELVQTSNRAGSTAIEALETSEILLQTYHDHETRQHGQYRVLVALTALVSRQLIQKPLRFGHSFVSGLEYLRRLGKIIPCFSRLPKPVRDLGERRQQPQQAVHGSGGTQLRQRLGEQRKGFLWLAKFSQRPSAIHQCPSQ